MYISHSGDNKLRNFLPDSWPIKRKSKSSRHFLGIFTRAWRQLNVQVFTSNFNCINWTMSGIKILKIWKDTWLYEEVVKSISSTAFGQTQL